MTDDEEKVAVLTCPFCRGRGTDPFALLSKMSRCEVCKGKGKIRISGPYVKCAFCGGSGIQPYTTSRLHCQACHGKGVVPRIEPSQPCPECDGRGVQPRRPHPMPCPRCKGQGIIRAIEACPLSGAETKELARK